MRWSLDSIYKSFDCEEFNRDYKIIVKEAKEAKLWCEQNFKDFDCAIEKLEYFIERQNYFYNIYWKLLLFCRLNFRVNTSNQQATKMQDEINAQGTILSNTMAAFQKWVGGLPDLESLISKSKLLLEHEFYLVNMAESSKHVLNDNEENIISLMKSSGSNSWYKLYQRLTASLLAEINIDGENKQLTLPVIHSMAYNKEQGVRKAAYEAEYKAYKSIEDSAAACLSAIKREAITLSKLRKYNSTLEQVIFEDRMDKEILDSMFDAIKDSLPILRKHFYKKAELLNHKNGLPYYDVFAPLGDINIKFTFDDAASFIIKSFNTYSSRLGDFAKKAFEEKWIDAEPRQGKIGGAMCSYMNWIKESRILTNFTGTFNDVAALAHELGHAYHGSCLNNENHLNSWYTASISESAAIFCESIVREEAIKTAPAENQVQMLEMSLRSSAQLIINISSRFIFEDVIFKRMEDASLSADQIKSIMVAARKEAYGDALDEEYMHPYEWIEKPHYYLEGLNYYNYPYAFGVLFAKGLQAEYIKRGEVFIEDFEKMLSATGKMKTYDLGKLMNIDLRSKDFWTTSLGMIEEEINKFLTL